MTSPPCAAIGRFLSPGPVFNIIILIFFRSSILLMRFQEGMTSHLACFFMRERYLTDASLAWWTADWTVKSSKKILINFLEYRRTVNIC